VRQRELTKKKREGARTEERKTDQKGKNRGRHKQERDCEV
jgi:hypothetical protein